MCCKFMRIVLFHFSYPGLVSSLGRFSPLKNPVLKCTQQVSRIPVKGPVKKTNRPLSYRNWDEASMREAVSIVHSKEMSISGAATLHGIPRSTLNDHCHGRVLPGARSGRPTILSSTEERDLVQFLLSSAKIGYARTRSELISIVERMLSVRDDHQTVMIGWWNKFCKCHPELVLRTPASLSLSRASASIKECIDNYFDVLEKFWTIMRSTFTNFLYGQVWVSTGSQTLKDYSSAREKKIQCQSPVAQNLRSL